MWIHSHRHKHENYKDSNANKDAFLAVQFPAARLMRRGDYATSGA